MADELTPKELKRLSEAEQTIKLWTEWPTESWNRLSDETRNKACRELDHCGVLISQFRQSGKYISPDK
jgi:hypothetical protein